MFLDMMPPTLQPLEWQWLHWLKLLEYDYLVLIMTIVYDFVCHPLAHINFLRSRAFIHQFTAVSICRYALSLLNIRQLMSK